MRRFPFLILSLLLVTPNWAFAAWIAGGLPVAVGPGSQARPLVVPDGSGGVVVAWDTEGAWAGQWGDVYAQRVDQDGNLLWGAGVPVCACSGYQLALFIATDGAGGAIVAWKDSEAGAAGADRIFAARLDGNGQVLWTRMVAHSLDNPFSDSRMTSDGVGGVVFTWTMYSDAYAQRLDGNGQAMWGLDGTRINGGGEWGQHAPQVALDGSDRVFLVWGDERSSFSDPGGFHPISDIYGQHLSLTGEQQWAPDGVLLRPGNTMPEWTMITGATDGIAIAFRVALTTVFARAMSSSGDVAWGDIPVCTAAPGEKRYPSILEDGAVGHLVIWGDQRNGSWDIYAQRLGQSGSPMWTADGVLVSGGAGNQGVYAVVADGTGGLMAVVGQTACCGSFRLERLGGNATKPWGDNGVPISDAPSYEPSLVLDDGHVFCAWMDYRNGTYDVFLQRFNVADGTWGSTVAVAISSFEARASAVSVRLNATFRSDLTVEGVNIYRGGANGSMLRLTEAEPRSERFEYVDARVTTGATYRYQIGVVDADGEFLSPVETVTLPRATTLLEQNSPNPFNPGTTIRFTLAEREHARLAIYAADGRLVRTLLDAMRNVGSYELSWDGRDDRGTSVTSGVYFYRLTAGKFSDSRRMVLLK